MFSIIWDKINVFELNWISCSHNRTPLFGRMLKQPGLISLDLHLSVILCNCWTYEDNIGLKFKKAELCHMGSIKYVQKNNFNRYRVRKMEKTNPFQPFFYFRTFFEHIFQHIYAPLLGLSWKTKAWGFKIGSF